MTKGRAVWLKKLTGQQQRKAFLLFNLNQEYQWKVRVNGQTQIYVGGLLLFNARSYAI